MRPITPIRFNGSASSSRTVTPEPESRPTSPDSVSSDTDTAEQLKVSGNTAKDLLTRGVITQQDYELLCDGLNRAHLEIRNKTNLARAWQARSRQLDRELDKVWDDLIETEDQLAVIQKDCQTTEKHLGVVQQAYTKTSRALNQYKLNQTQIIQDNVRLKHELAKRSPAQSQEKPKLQSNFSKKISVTPEKTPFHKRPLKQQLLIHNKTEAEQQAKRTEESGSH